MRPWSLERPELAALPTIGGNYLSEIMPEHAGLLFELIDANRAYLSQFGDKTSIRNPNLTAVLTGIFETPSHVLRMGVWDSSLTVLMGAMRLEVIFDETIYLGAWIGAQYAGHGVITDALATLLRYAWHTLGIRVGLADAHHDNKPSRRVLEKCGFVPYDGPIAMWLPDDQFGRLAWYGPADM